MMLTMSFMCPGKTVAMGRGRRAAPPGRQQVWSVRHRIQAQPSDRVGVGKDYDIRVRHQNCNEITSTGWNADFQNEQLNLPMTQMFCIWVPSFLNTIAACSGKGEGMEL